MGKHIPMRTRAKDDPEWQLGDFPGSIAVADSEKAYRRGFSQGVSIARQLLEKGLTIDEMEEWEAKLMKWRWASNEWIKGQPVMANWPPIPYPAAAKEESPSVAS